MPYSTERALDYPAHLGRHARGRVEELARRYLRAHGDNFVGLILSGSAGRALATDRSDLDVYVVLTDDAAANETVTHSATVDVVPISLDSLEKPPQYGSPDWWYRWSFAWAPVLLDTASGRVQSAAIRQATLTPDEQTSILIAHDRLDGWINFAYRALKSSRDGLEIESQLDAVESLPWLLDVIFTLAGRVRPYNKYLPWELREHPLTDWQAPSLLSLVRRTLEGDPAAIRESFDIVQSRCRDFDARQKSDRLTRVIQDWGPELALLRGTNDLE